MRHFGSLSLAEKSCFMQELFSISSFLELQGKFEKNTAQNNNFSCYVFKIFLRCYKRITLTCRFVNFQHGF